LTNVKQHYAQWFNSLTCVKTHNFDVETSLVMLLMNTSFARRIFIQGMTLAPVLYAGPASAQNVALWNKAAFSAKSFAEVMRLLGAPNGMPAETSAIQIAEPDTTEGIKIRLEISSRLTQVDQVAILVEKNPATLAAIFNLPSGTEANLLTHIKVSETSLVMVAMRSEGKWWAARRVFTSTGGGCGGAGEGNLHTGPTLIRPVMREGKTLVRTRITHPMVSQMARDPTGRPIPPWFIQTLRASHLGRTVLEAQFSTAIARDPSLNFVFQGAKPGERLQISWVDNKGEARSDEGVIS
jgi:sulfur-oxidizing protein SoxY